MKKLVFTVFICLIGFVVGTYKLTSGFDSYIAHAESFEGDTLVALEKIRQKGDVVDYEKVKSLIVIASDRSLSKLYFGIHHKLEIFLLALLFGLIVFYEIRSSGMLNKNTRRKTQA